MGFTRAITVVGAFAAMIGIANTAAPYETLPPPAAVAAPRSSNHSTTSTSLQINVPATVAATPIRGTTVQVADTLPSPPAWTGPIPEYYGTGTGCSPVEASIVANVMWGHGASDDTVLWMLTTISRESTCDPDAYNGNRNTGDDSWGLCQLNKLAGFFDSDGILGAYNPALFAGDFAYNVNACADLWEVCGRGPWTKGDYGCRTPEELR